MPLTGAPIVFIPTHADEAGITVDREVLNDLRAEFPVIQPGFFHVGYKKDSSGKAGGKGSPVLDEWVCGFCGMGGKWPGRNNCRRCGLAKLAANFGADGKPGPTVSSRAEATRGQLQRQIDNLTKQLHAVTGAGGVGGNSGGGFAEASGKAGGGAFCKAGGGTPGKACGKAEG